MKKLIFSVLIVSLFFGLYPNVVIYNFTGVFLKVYLFDICMLLAFIVSIFLKKYKYFKFDLFVYFFALFNVILLILNTKFLFSPTSVLYLLRFVVFTLSYPLFIYVFKNLKNYSTKLLFLVGSLSVVTNLLVFLLYPNVLIPSFDPHIFRLYGQFIDPNYYGVFLVVLLILLLKYKTAKLVKLVMFLLILLSIYLTFSRIAILLLLLVFVIESIKTKSIYYFSLIVGFIGLMSINTRYLFRFLFIEGNFNSAVFRVIDTIEGLLVYKQATIPTGFNNLKIYNLFLTSNVNNSTTYYDFFVLNILNTLGFVGVILFAVLLTTFASKKINPLLLFILFIASFLMNIVFNPVFLIILVVSSSYYLASD